MFTPANGDEARKYIRYSTGRDANDKAIELDEQGRLKVDEHRQIKVDHVALANVVLKYINVIPGIPHLSRKIMNLRIVNPGMSNMATALALGIREHEIPLWEQEGLYRVKQFISRISMQDATDKFNTERLIEAEIKNMNKDNANPMMTGPQEETT